jgi:hypothetical protein
MSKVLSVRVSDDVYESFISCLQPLNLSQQEALTRLVCDFINNDRGSTLVNNDKLTPVNNNESTDVNSNVLTSEDERIHKDIDAFLKSKEAPL